MNPRTILLSSTFLALVLTACPGSGSTEFTVNLSSPSGTAYTNGTLNVQATVTSGTPDSLELLRNGTPLANLTAPYSYAWDTSALPEGGYSLGVQATKGGKGVQGEARTVFVDRTAPTVSLTSATATLTAAGSLDLNADVSDSRGVAKVEFFDGDQKLGEATSSPFALRLNLSSSDNREHTYSAKATDRAGNSTTSTLLKISVLIPKRTSENLIVNGDAEAGPASPSADYVSDLPGWPGPFTSVLRFTVVAYGLGSFPSQAEAPPNAGNNLFAGGPDKSPLPSVPNPFPPNNPDSTINSAFQIIALPADWYAAIDAGTVTFDLSGFFGSIGNLNDTGFLSAFFTDSSGKTTFKSVELAGVSALDRGGKTGFVQRTITAELPKQTRTALVVLRLFRSTARYQYNRGLADNLSLVLRAY
jgi:Bacterial Ig domain